MLFRTSLKQTLRTPVKLVAYFLITALVAAFLCVGLNLYQKSEENIAAAEDCFTTIAVPEAYAEMTRGGTLMREFTEEDYAPFLLTDEQIANMGLPAGTKAYGSFPPELQPAGYTVAYPTETELEFEKLEEPDGIMQAELGGRFGAMVKNGLSFGTHGRDALELMPSTNDVIIFTLNGTGTVTAPNYYSDPDAPYESYQRALDVTVHEWANPLLEYGDTLVIINKISPDAFKLAELYGGTVDFPLGTEANDGSFSLEAGKQYIMMLSSSMPRTTGNKLSGTVDAAVGPTDYYAERFYYYDEDSSKQCDAAAGVQRNAVCLVEEYAEGFFATEKGRFFQEAITAIKINVNSLTAITTNDLSAMRPFHSGKVYIPEGRAFTEAEYANGEKVCLVSAAMAELNGWKTGDTLPLSFYRCDPMRYCDEPQDITSEWKYSTYNMPDSSGFFDEGEFTIVGMFDGRVEKSQRKQYNSTTDKLHMVNVIIPEASVQNAPEPRIYKYTSSIRLENSKAIDFITAMQASGLMDSAEGEYGSYELRLTVYDQGYSLVAPGLNQLSRVSRLTLLLSAAAAGLAVLVLAVIHVLRMRREIAAMRSLGTKKRQIMAIALSGVLLVCLLGAAVGACAGHVLSAEVTERVLASAEEDAADTTFTAMMGEETAKEFTFALESEPRLALAAGGAVVAVFAVFAALLLAAELQKPPMVQLGVKE